MLQVAMVPARRGWLYAVAAALLLPAWCFAADVQVVAITPGRSVDVVIAGGPPMTIEVGETAKGITVVKVNQRSAVLRIDGVTKTLSLAVSRGSADHTGSVTLRATANGHYFTNATVNGRSMRFLVDTGATLVVLSRADAERIGLNYQRGIPALTNTANGIGRGWRLSLHTVRLGGMTVHDVDAFVADSDLSVGLLGMSFLSRFDMHRTGSTLELRRRR